MDYSSFVKDYKENGEKVVHWNADGQTETDIIEGFAAGSTTFYYDMTMQVRLNDLKNNILTTLDTRVLQKVPLQLSQWKDASNGYTTQSEIVVFSVRDHVQGAPVKFIIKDTTEYSTGQTGFPLLKLRIVVNKDIPGKTPERIYVDFPWTRPKGNTASLSIADAHRSNRMVELDLSNVHTIHVFFDLDNIK